MRVLIAASEVFPYAKTGGLADVVGALPRALERLGLEVAVCMPLYPQVRSRGDDLTVVREQVSCPFAHANRPYRLLEGRLPDSNVPVYFVENSGVFEVESAIYGSQPGSYGDGHLRFLYFSRAVLRVPHATGFFPDVFHVNDWQTSLVPPLLRTVYRDDQRLNRAATVLTIHNLAYQGAFPLEDLKRAGLPGFLMAEGRLLERGHANLLAGGLRFADAINTVSRSYAEEILTPEFAAGLDDVLHWRRDLLGGIVNGLDTDVWDPSRDPALVATYTAEDLSGKELCKRALLNDFHLAPTEGPVVGIVSRLVSQKGLDLAVGPLDHRLATEPDFRLTVLGSGAPDLEAAFEGLARRHPGRAGVRIGFDDALSHRIEAGADLFMMPSRFEPCGLNQLISMRYGTPPIVHRVGGLKDTVTPANTETLAAGTATGFPFDDATWQAVHGTLDHALHLYRHDRPAFDGMRRAGLRSDWSWTRSAQEYVALYETAQRRAREGRHLSAALEGLPPDPLEIELPPLASVPASYPRDLLFVIPRDPKTLYARWSRWGPDTESWLQTLSDEQRGAASFELVLEDTGTNHRQGRTIARDGDSFLTDVVPGGHYRVEIFGHAPGCEGRKLAESRIRALPGDHWPEG